MCLKRFSGLDSVRRPPNDQWAKFGHSLYSELYVISAYINID